MVAVALLLVSLGLYPAVRAKLNDQLDHTLVVAAAQARNTLAEFSAKFADDGIPPDSRPCPSDIGTIEAAARPPPVERRTHPKIRRPDRPDVAVADRRRRAVLPQRRIPGRRYRIYTAPLPGTPGWLVRTATPAVDPARSCASSSWLLAGSPRPHPAAVLASRLAAAPGATPRTPAHRDGREDPRQRRPDHPGAGRGPRRDRPARRRVRHDDRGAGRICRRPAPPGRRRLARAAHPADQPRQSTWTLLAENPRDDQAPQLVSRRTRAGQRTHRAGQRPDRPRPLREADVHTEDIRLDLVARAGRRPPRRQLRPGHGADAWSTAIPTRWNARWPTSSTTR